MAEPSQQISIIVDKFKKSLELGQNGGDLFSHFLGDMPITWMAGRGRAEFAQPLESSEIHMEIPMEAIGTTY